MRAMNLVLAGILLTGCSGSAGTSGNAETSGPGASPAWPSLAAPTAIAELPGRIRCEGFDAGPEEAPEHVAEYGTCYLWGEDPPNPVGLYRFDSESDMARFWTAVADEGMTPDQAATVGLIMVYPEVREDLPRLKRELGLSQ